MKREKTNLIKQKAHELGFQFCGISRAERLNEHEAHLNNWLEEKQQAGMSYMENHKEKRLDPTLLVPGAKSVISLMYNYFPENDTPSTTVPKISRYAYGTDYHFVIKDKLKQLFNYINAEIEPIEGRVFVDSAPVLERAWAEKSGLGWIGKNSMLINKQMGSYFFLAELISNIELEPDGPIRDYCGSCTACLDACPTQAIVPEKRTVNSNRCISFWTIENKTDSIPEAISEQQEGWAFGCDICQEVCPWNRFSQPHNEMEFKQIDWDDLGEKEWRTMDKPEFNRRFKKSPLKRAGWKGLQRNLKALDLLSKD